MSRTERFLSYKDHPWLKKVFATLSRDDRSIALDFIKNNDGLGPQEFERLVIRMFLDKPKPKNWTSIEELLVCANSDHFSITRKDIP